MDATLESPDARTILDTYRTCELATLSRSGPPIAWPTTPRYQPESGTVVITTSIGLPQKVFNIRRDGRVGLLFSDPTGSGHDGLPQLLVQGTATCTDEIVTSPDAVDGLAEWWQRLWSMQPSGRSIGADPVTRALMDWYYRRIVITVRPTRVHLRPPLPPPARQTSSSRGGPRGSTSGEALRHLAPFDSAVLVARDPGGAPWLLRVRPDRVPSGRLAVDVPAGEPVAPGPASLLAHRHDASLGGLRSAVVVGDLVRQDDRWVLVPTRLVPGADANPAHAVRMVRGCRRAARAYVERRHLPPPAVDWEAFAALKARTPEPAGRH